MSILGIAPVAVSNLRYGTAVLRTSYRVKCTSHSLRREGVPVCKRVAVAVKKGGCPRIILYDRGAVRVVISEIKLYAIKFVLKNFQNNDVLKYDIYDTEN